MLAQQDLPMGPALALAFKDIKLLLRDRANAFFTFVFPLLIAVFFGVIFSRSGESNAMDIAVVNEDGGPASVSFVDDLKKDAALTVHLVRQEKIDDKPTGRTFPLTRENGMDLVRRGRVTACVIVPKGFEDSAGGMFAGRAMEIEALVDPTHNAEAGLLTGKLNEIAFRQLAKRFGSTADMKKMLDQAKASVAGAKDLDPVRKLLFDTMFSSIEAATVSVGKEATDAGKPDPNADSPLAGWMPVKVSVKELAATHEGPNNSYEFSFPQGVVWGLMGCVVAFGASLASERARDTLMRLTTAPISRSQILLGKALACFLSCIFVQLLLLGFSMMPPFRVRVLEPGTLVATILCSAVGFTGIMMLMAGLSKSEGAASGFGRAIVLILAMIGGGTVPLFFAPKFIQTLSNVSPFKWANEAWQGALWRGMSIHDVALPLGVMLGFGVVGFVIGTSAFKWTAAS
jgi:ABC-2 type transport system permease protein